MTKQNIFSEIGFSDGEAAKLEMKFYLMEGIRTFIERQNLTQAKAADFFGTTQPKISLLMNGDPAGYTIDRLVKMIARTGGTFNYSFRQPKKAPKQIARKTRQAQVLKEAY